MIPDRFSTAGLAHSAADAKTAETGERWQMVFRPRSNPHKGRIDPRPFTIERKES